MKWTVVVPGALVTERAPGTGSSTRSGLELLPETRTRLARAERQPDVSLPDAADGAAATWLWQRFGGTGAPKFAPYAWHAIHGEPPAQQTWYCDPVHFAVARDHLVMSPLDSGLDEADTHALVDSASPVARAAGATLHPPAIARRASHWMLQFERPWDLATTPLAAAAGRSIFELMPEGTDATRWRKLLNDIQVEWHQLPMNERRESRGQLPVNAVWLHGGGTWSALPPAPFSSVVAADPAVRGWSLAAGLPAERIRASVTPQAADHGDTLIVDTSLLDADAIAIPSHANRGSGTGIGGIDEATDLRTRARADAWTALLDRLSNAFGDGRRPGPASIDLLLAGERTIRRLTLRRSDGWRLWRRTTPAELLAELLVE